MNFDERDPKKISFRFHPHYTCEKDIQSKFENGAFGLLIGVVGLLIISSCKYKAIRNGAFGLLSGIIGLPIILSCESG